MEISIKKIKEIRENLDLTHLVIFGIDSTGEHHVATHGRSRIHAIEAAEMGNSLKEELEWAKALCRSRPLDRICEHCDFWQYHKIEPGDRVPENLPGECLFEPDKHARRAKDRACSCFEPKV